MFMFTTVVHTDDIYEKFVKMTVGLGLTFVHFVLDVYIVYRIFE